MDPKRYDFYATLYIYIYLYYFRIFLNLVFPCIIKQYEENSDFLGDTVIYITMQLRNWFFFLI